MGAPIKKLSILGLTGIMAFGFWGCSAGQSGSGTAAVSNTDSKPQPSKDPVKIVFWNSGYPTIDANNKTKKREDFYIFQAISRFEKVNPGVTVEVQDVPSNEEMFTKFQTASIAKNGPDLTVLWSGTYMLRFKQFLEPMDSYFKKEERSRITGWEAVAEGFKEDGKIYGVPFSTDGIFALFYNKKILADAGVNPEQKPLKNYNEFVAMLQKVKDKGTTPIGLQMPVNFWHIPSYWIAQTVTPAGLGELVQGKRNFSDPKLAEIMKAWNQLYDKGLAVSDTSNQARQLFYKGQVAMVLAGNKTITEARKALGDDLGIMKVPDFNEDVQIHDGGVGGVGNAFVVTSYSKNKKESVDFIKFLMSKEEQINKIKSGEGSLTVVKDVNVNEFIDEPLIRDMQTAANKPSAIFWPDNIFPSELTSEIASLQSLVFTGKMTTDEFLKKIDKKRDEVLNSNK
ncbi:ABC transporter substrate-binding protein [Paenibacillus periandrae]|uniref:ABC transporter substrate-binding protein n=1 Tax=Paenibacillus periandrae TaxID=1761741 RepID=UPI001F08D0A3|nr:extracellular solute-binding protein [Paenibacillus periandrae]